MTRTPPFFDNSSDSADDAISLSSSYQGPTTTLWSGEFEHRKGAKPSKLLDLSPPLSTANSGNLPF